MSDPQPAVVTRRRRSSSLLQYIAEASENAEHHLSHLGTTPIDEASDIPRPLPPPSGTRPVNRRKTSSRLVTNKPVVPAAVVIRPEYGPRVLRWVSRPDDSFLVVGSIFAGWAAWRVLLPVTWRDLNPFSPFVTVQHRVVPQPDFVNNVDDDDARYQKGWLDLLFLVYWIVVFSFARQVLTLGPIRALGRRFKLKGRKLERFQEQGYSVVYFALSSACGIYVLRQQDSWWYKTEHFWLDYPHHWAMTRSVKTYYLTQFAYWLQQSLVMIAGLEKPREDYVELILHHCVTAWLIGSSYTVNLTQIGLAVYFSMDLPDFMLAVSKCLNYIGGRVKTTSEITFVAFMFAWGYLRHYENIRILHSVWTEFELIPEYARVWSPAQGYWLPSWMRYQIFAPIFALQILNAFWSYLILRVVVRMFTGKGASDVREEGESESEGGGGGGGGVTGGHSNATATAATMGRVGSNGGNGTSSSLRPGLSELRSRSRSGTMDSISEAPVVRPRTPATGDEQHLGSGGKRSGNGAGNGNAGHDEEEERDEGNGVRGDMTARPITARTRSSSRLRP